MNIVIRAILLALLVFVAPLSATAKHHTQHHHRFVSPLKGSRAALVAQNRAADKAHLQRFKSNAQLRLKEKARVLVKTSYIPGVIDSRISTPENKYLLPNAERFLRIFAKKHLKKWHRSLVLTSAVRSKDYQRSLRGRNRNAARSDTGLLQTSHTTGETFDISKKVMVPREVVSTRLYLLTQVNLHKIIVEEEDRQPCFHIMVLPSRSASPLKSRRHHRG